MKKKNNESKSYKWRGVKCCNSNRVNDTHFTGQRFSFNTFRDLSGCIFFSTISHKHTSAASLALTFAAALRHTSYMCQIHKCITFSTTKYNEWAQNENQCKTISKYLYIHIYFNVCIQHTYKYSCIHFGLRKNYILQHIHTLTHIYIANTIHEMT